MAKLIRKTLKVFGGSGATSNFAQFGSLQFGVPLKTKDIASIQALATWDDGYQNALYTGNRALLLEDLNSWSYLHSYMSAYLLQEGIAEWDAGTNYFLNSIVKLPGTTQLFGSLQNNNLGNTPPTSASNAFWSWLNPPVPTSFPIGNGVKENLKVVPNNGAPLSKVDVSADRLSVQGVILAPVSYTADVTVTGVNGRDTGTEQLSSWYALFVICNDAGTLAGSLLSLATTPTLPVGYTKFRRVSWVRNNASGNFVSARRVGDTVLYYNPPANNQYNPANPVGFNSCIPPDCWEALFQVDSQSTSGFFGYGNISVQPYGAFGGVTGSIAFVFMGSTPGYGSGQLASILGDGQQITFTGSSGYKNIQVVSYVDPV